ncbi:MAG: hypothetical protein IKC03_00930 [Oscillospiraceae bacterium]|nr:hypothetical protein [Oscillospiraceae bacterium]
MDHQNLEYLQRMEQHGAEHGWVAAPTAEDRDYLTHFRAVCKRYNIVPSKATRLEYDFVTRVTDSEFYLQQVNA